MAEIKGKGKGAVVVASPAPGRRKGEGAGGKGQVVPHSTRKTAVASVSRSVQVKGKAPVSSSTTRTIFTKTTKKKKKSGTTVRVKAVKKVYSLPGQKYDPPEEREPLRIFYESLSKQIPSSEMAEFWMMEHGLLPHEKAKKAHERKQKRQRQLGRGTPIKISKPGRSESTKKKTQLLKNEDSKARKRVNYSDEDNYFLVKLKKTKI